MNEMLNKIKLILKDLMIDLSDLEIDMICKELVGSIKQIDEIKDIDFSHLEDLNFNDINVNNFFREDVIVDFKNKKELLENPKEIRNNLIKV